MYQIFFRFRFAMKFGKLNFIVPVCKKLQELVACILIKEQWQYSPFFNSCNRLLQGKSKDFETGFQVLFTTQPRLPLSYAGQFPDTPDKGENHDENTAATLVVRKPMRTENALMLGLFGLTLVAGFASSKSLHIAAGLALTGAIGWHVYKRRKAL